METSYDMFILTPIANLEYRLEMCTMSPNSCIRAFELFEALETAKRCMRCYASLLCVLDKRNKKRLKAMAKAIALAEAVQLGVEPNGANKLAKLSVRLFKL